MSIPEVARNLVRELGVLLQLPGTELDDDGYCGLIFDNRTQVGLQYHAASGKLVVFASLGPVVPERRDEAYETMLRANRFWMGTGGATLSLEDGDPPVGILAESLECEGRNAAGLADELARFVDVADSWSSYLGGLEEDAVTSESGPPAFGLRA